MHGTGSSEENRSSFHLMYGGYGQTLVLLLEGEHDMTTRCALRTLDDPSAISSGPVFETHGVPPSSAVLPASLLREAFAELDWSAPRCTLRLSPEAPHFALECLSEGQAADVEYPDSVFEEFDVTVDCIFQYKMQLLQPVAKALQQSEKVKIEVNQLGVLRTQHLLMGGVENFALAEFLLVPEESEVV